MEEGTTSVMCELARLDWVGLPADFVLCEFIWLFRNYILGIIVTEEETKIRRKKTKIANNLITQK